MKTSFLDAKKIGEQLKRLMSDFDEFRWAVAWGTSGDHANALLLNKKKIKNLLIGIHFCQTDPKLLKRLLNHPSSKVAVGVCSGTFHPKIYHFQSRQVASAVVGSANFTKAGTDGNEEAALLIEGKTDDPILRQIRMTVEKMWRKGQPIDQDFLAAYERQHAAAKKYRDALKRPIRVRRPASNARYPDLLQMTWGDYFRAVSRPPNIKPAHLLERLKVIATATKLFSRVRAFRDLTLLERKAIGGFIGAIEIDSSQELANHNWGWFGSMRGAGSFKHVIIKNNRSVSSALEEIPSRGEVTEQDYNAFVVEFRKAFAQEKREAGLATATRLLTMKRPDYFVCVDNENRTGLGSDLGFAPTTLNFDKYWGEVVDPLIHSSWWQVRRPVGLAGQIWDARAAMVDVLYYEV